MDVFGKGTVHAPVLRQRPDKPNIRNCCRRATPVVSRSMSISAKSRSTPSTSMAIPSTWTTGCDHILRIGLNCRFDGPVLARSCGTRLLRRHLYEIVQFAWNLQGRRSLDIRACQLRNRRYVPLNGKTAFPAATKLGRLA